MIQRIRISVFQIVSQRKVNTPKGFKAQTVLTKSLPLVKYITAYMDDGEYPIDITTDEFL